MIALTEHASGGTILAVRAQPGARRDALLGEHDGALRISVQAPPERGKANAAIAEVLAESIGCKSSAVTLLSGATSRQKRFLVEGIAPADLLRRFQALLPQDLFDNL